MIDWVVVVVESVEVHILGAFTELSIGCHDGSDSVDVHET